MNTLGRTIRLFLPTGTAAELRTAEIINWTGKLFVFARTWTSLRDFSRRDEASRTGIYFLIGENPEDPVKKKVYVGESSNIRKRLAVHHTSKSKSFWTQTVVVISKDENLTKAHVEYLERRIIKLATDAKRATVVNRTEPDLPPLPESDIADMEYFLSQVQMLLPVLGFSFIQPMSTISQSETQDDLPVPASSELSPIFVLTLNKEEIARAQEIETIFVVGKGSKAKKMSTASLYISYQQKREQLRNAKILSDSDDDDFWIFTENFEFDSPSAAAAVITGGNINGRLAWKRQDTGETYAAWNESRLKQADESSDAGAETPADESSDAGAETPADESSDAGAETPADESYDLQETDDE